MKSILTSGFAVSVLLLGSLACGTGAGAQGNSVQREAISPISVSSKAAVPMSKNKIVLNKQTARFVAAGKVPGLGVHTGMTKSQVQKIYGKQTDSFYYFGGEFFIFERLPNTAFCFEGAGGKFSSVLIESDDLSTKTFASVKKTLGKPDTEGLDEMGEFAYQMLYTYNDNTMYFQSYKGRTMVSTLLIIFR
ncbi:hypothetical protein [Saccharibacillus alkalitolerans]|uniref:DUF4309 domain-containing protein n=1 Tax=Saccharibacillus alkalitolerans TaxID=2705290 RepID=A0ABX0EZN0_9BACL|nr:hypothetical protein [Saccharibacillus alkalitolerans]NGZ74212.1 hypothetical protein [Saccharibacillus alkalitolerans]